MKKASRAIRRDARRARGAPANATNRAKPIIAIHAERGLPAVERASLRRAWRAVLDHEPNAPARVSVALLSDASMARLHEEYMGEAGPTDVLSFDLRGGPGAVDGEIAIGVEVAAREAFRRRLGFQREVDLYLVHGLLHLAGYDDHAPRDRARMRAAERRALARCLPPRTGVR
jgi:probable rRNA maturation factor